MTVSYRRTVIGQLQLDCDDPVTECLLVCGPPSPNPLQWQTDVSNWLRDRYGWSSVSARIVIVGWLHEKIHEIENANKGKGG